MAALVVKEPDAWERMGTGANRLRTYTRPISVALIVHGDETIVIVPVGHGYECEGGHEAVVYPNEAAFLMKYSWQQLA